MASLFTEEEEETLDALAEEVDAAHAPADGDVQPRNNPDLFGHEEAEKAILADFNAGRMPHALIIGGPPGIGKATLAYRLTRFFLAQGSDGQGPSLFGDAAPPESLYIGPEHPVFRRVASGGHADMLTIEREFDEKKGKMKRDIAVEQTWEIPRFMRKTAAEGGWRVVIVDGAEDINRSSENSLLKILEEPPLKSLLILVTTQPGALLPTTRSRCRLIQLQPLEDRVISQLVEKYLSALPADQKTGLARLAEGSIGKALQFHQEGGLAIYAGLLEVLSNLPEMDVPRARDLTEKLGRYDAERAYDTACEILTGWCSYIARMQARGLPLAGFLPDDGAVFTKLATAYPANHFVSAGEKMTQLFRQTAGLNLDKRQALMNAFLMLQKPDFALPNL